MASTYLSRTAGTSTENYKYTFSAWVKRTGILGSSSVNEVLFSNWYDDNNSAYIRFEDIDDNLHVYDKYGSTIDLNYKTNMKFRDNNAWYHIVVNVDGTRSANQRCKIYVNGSEVSCSSTTDTGGTLAMKTVTTTNAMRLGAINNTGGTEYYFSGLMSHVHYIDGTGYDASAFGEYDANGVWKIKTDVSVTYGNNGFFILKDGNSVTDQSGNGNNFTVAGGTLTNTEDNPSNVFATLNPLDKAINGTLPTFAYGNTQWTASGNSTSNNAVRGTLGNSNGKYYFEAKLLEATNTMIGVHLTSVSPFYNGDGYMGNNSGFYGIYINGSDDISARVAGSSGASGLGSVTNNDIIGCAFDFDNNKFYFSKNGTWLNSGDPTSGATGTGSFGTLASGLYVPAITNVSWTTASSTAFNFGNGYFGTTAVASAGTNASGNGIFEYDVPTGFTALSTKGLNL